MLLRINNTYKSKDLAVELLWQSERCYMGTKCKINMLGMLLDICVRITTFFTLICNCAWENKNWNQNGMSFFKSRPTFFYPEPILHLGHHRFGTRFVHALTIHKHTVCPKTWCILKLALIIPTKYVGNVSHWHSDMRRRKVMVITKRQWRIELAQKEKWR